MKKIFLFILLPFIFIFGCVKDRIQPVTIVAPVANDTLMYYWNFNSADSSKRAADFSVMSGGVFNYYCSYIDYTDGSTINLHTGSDSGSCLRLRNPADSIIFRMPTTGYDSVTFSFAERRSNSGPSLNTISYTVDGTHFTTVTTGVNPYTIDTLFNRYDFILSNDGNINNNPKFAIKIAMSNNNTGTSGNDRIDNVSLKGKKR